MSDIEVRKVTLTTEFIKFEDIPVGTLHESRIHELDGDYDSVNDFADKVFSHFGYGREIRFRHTVDDYGNFYLHLYLNDNLLKPTIKEIQDYYDGTTTLNSGHISAKIIGDFGQDFIENDD